MILLNILKTVRHMNVILIIMDLCDTKIDPIIYRSIYRSMTHILWSRVFAIYILKVNVLDLNHFNTFK